MKLRNAVLRTIAFTLLAASASAVNEMKFKAKLRPEVQVDIQATVLKNPDAKNGSTVLLVPGLAHTGNAFRPLVETLFSDSKAQISTAVLLDLPGRGGSGLPECPHNLSFGQLDINDFASVLLETLTQLKRQHSGPQVIIGHSMGCLIVEAAQERLLAENKSLRQEFGVDRVILIASSSPAGVANPFADTGAGMYLLSLYTVETAELGKHVAIDAPSFINFFFTTPARGIVPGAPTAEALASFGYKSVEAYAACVQTVGTPDLRPQIRAGAFKPAHGTRTRVVAGEQDSFGMPGQQQMLYKFLTGDETLSEFKVIPGEDTAHDLMITRPAALASALGIQIC